jgi:hypothetical protein
LRPHGSLVVDWVEAIVGFKAGLGGALTGLREANDVKGTKPHLPSPTFKHVPEDPRLRVEGADLEIEPVAVTIEARLVGGANRGSAKLVAFSSHWISNSAMSESTHNF